MSFGRRVRTRALWGMAILAVVAASFGYYWKCQITKMKMTLPEVQIQAFLDCLQGKDTNHIYYLFVQQMDSLLYGSPSDYVLSNVKTKFPLANGFSDSQELRPKSDIYKLISNGSPGNSSGCILSVTPHLWKGEAHINCTLYSGGWSGGEYEYRAKWSGDSWVLGFPTSVGIN